MTRTKEVRYVLANKDEAENEVQYQGYRYRSPDLSELWITSVPKSQQAAVDYIDQLIWFFRGKKDCIPEFIEGRTEQGTYEPIKWEVVNDSGERVPFLSAVERGLR